MRADRWTRRLLLAGFIPLPWFLVFAGLAGALSPGYDGTSQHLSELTTAPGLPHVAADIALIGSGVAFVLFAAGLWRATERPVSFGSGCWILFGISMISNGIWPMGSPLHGLYGVGLVNLVAPALSHLELSRPRGQDRLVAVTTLVSLAGVCYLWLSLTGNDPGSYRGLTQRLFASINALWPAAAAFHLRRET